MDKIENLRIKPKQNNLTEREVIEHLKAVVDPELQFNIVDLGLVYEAKVDNKNNSIIVRMTLTSPGCPYGPEIFEAVGMVLQSLGLHEKKVVLVWDPPWDPATMASDEVKDKLGMW